MVIKEFRIVMPLSLEEYNIGQLFASVETSKLETGGGDGIEDLANEAFTNYNMTPFGNQSGQYTKKRIHMDQKLPGFLRLLTPKGCLYLQEESWNAFPYCKTVMLNEYLGERLALTFDTIHLADRGTTENALDLPPEKLQQREVIFIDIAQNQGEEDEAGINSGTIDGAVSRKTGRGPLEPGWFNNHTPVMTCYKLVTCEVRIFGIQNRLESFILHTQKKVFTAFHRRIFLLMDQWYGLTFKDLRELEERTTLELKELRRSNNLRGSRES